MSLVERLYLAAAIVNTFAALGWYMDKGGYKWLE